MPATTAVTTTTTTTAPCDSCTGNYTWNQTGIILADTASSTIPQACCVFLPGNDTFHICGHTLRFVQSWVTGGASRTAVTNNTGNHIDYIRFNKDENMYTNAHDKNLVRRYAPNFADGTAVDDSYTLYIADQDNNRVAKLDQNATSSVISINTNGITSKLSALLLNPFVSNQIYISGDTGNTVYLWTFVAATPSITNTQVNCGSTLQAPRSIEMYAFGNLYVADQNNFQVVTYSANSTMGTIILSFTARPMDLALNSQLNLYVLLDNGKLYKHQLI
ncbi:unnamed protein product [Rotaria socialis]|uniref:Uncharacterized protein n=1 Tax=Rotaria socialis TaxID=392032 RepID=A0A820J0N9_9BILA|nr:unnamed protein product [Rotaria socialis]